MQFEASLEWDRGDVDFAGQHCHAPDSLKTAVLLGVQD